jgi:hypothetical protein
MKPVIHWTRMLAGAFRNACSLVADYGNSQGTTKKSKVTCKRCRKTLAFKRGRS